MELKEVVSSTVHAIGYQDDDLFVEFNHGVLYRYSKVPREVYEGLMNAESKGKFINSEVKNKYMYERVIKEG